MSDVSLSPFAYSVPCSASSREPFGNPEELDNARDEADLIERLHTGNWMEAKA